jgi:acetoin utilization protein AcuB
MTRTVDVMTERPTTVSPRATVETAIRLLEALEIRHLPVVNEAGELVGMLSDRDLRGNLGEDGGGPPGSARIVDIMNGDVIQANADDDLLEIAELMVDNKIGAVPIVDERGVLVGIVSYVDILRSLIADREH